MQNWDWQRKLDFTALLDSDTFEMQSECQETSLFKYYAFDHSFRQKFLTQPTVKFATKTELRDPFELTRRWETFGSKPTLDFFRKYLTIEIQRQLADSEFILQNFAARDEFKKSGLSLAQLRSILATPAAQGYVKMVEAFTLNQMFAMLPIVFERFSVEIDQIIDEAVREIGIFSLTSDPTSLHMWDHYGGGGEGFILEFDAQSSFFKVLQSNGSYRNRLYKVHYKDDRLADFWQNPLYLFSVKHLSYEYEREWRMLVGVKDCDLTELPGGTTIYTRPAPMGLIKSITFGHKWNDPDIRMALENINGFDGAIADFRTDLDLDGGRLVRSPLAV